MKGRKEGGEWYNYIQISNYKVHNKKKYQPMMKIAGWSVVKGRAIFLFDPWLNKSHCQGLELIFGVLS